MELIEIEVRRSMRREEVAAWLHELADSLGRHNGLTFDHDGIRYDVAVADQVTVEIELQVGDDGASLEVELSW